MFVLFCSSLAIFFFFWPVSFSNEREKDEVDGWRGRADLGELGHQNIVYRKLISIKKNNKK